MDDERADTPDGRLARLAARQAPPPPERCSTSRRCSRRASSSARSCATTRWARRQDLPQPILNTGVHGYVVDALFPEQRVIVEIDPWHTHGDPRAFAADRARDRRLLAAGHRTARITDEQFTPRTAAELRAVLAT